MKARAIRLRMCKVHAGGSALRLGHERESLDVRRLSLIHIYLPDMVEILKRHGHAVTISHCDDYRDGLGVNSRVQLAELTAIARDRINERLMTEGVTFIDPAQAWIGPDASVGRDTVVWPQTHLIGACRIGEGCQLGPNTRLTNVTAGDDCALDETVGIDVVIENLSLLHISGHRRPA